MQGKEGIHLGQITLFGVSIQKCGFKTVAGQLVGVFAVQRQRVKNRHKVIVKVAAKLGWIIGIYRDQQTVVQQGQQGMVRNRVKYA